MDGRRAGGVDPAVFYLLGHVQHMGLAMMGVAILILPTCIGAGAFFALIMEGFPKARRSFGTSVSYSLGVTLFGGFFRRWWPPG